MVVKCEDDRDRSFLAENCDAQSFFSFLKNGTELNAPHFHSHFYCTNYRRVNSVRKSLRGGFCRIVSLYVWSSQWTNVEGLILASWDISHLRSKYSTTECLQHHYPVLLGHRTSITFNSVFRTNGYITTAVGPPKTVQYRLYYRLRATKELHFKQQYGEEKYRLNSTENWFGSAFVISSGKAHELVSATSWFKSEITRGFTISFRSPLHVVVDRMPTFEHCIEHLLSTSWQLCKAYSHASLARLFRLRYQLYLIQYLTGTSG